MDKVKFIICFLWNKLYYLKNSIKEFIDYISLEKKYSLINLKFKRFILLEKIPIQQRVSIVHGDYRLDNVRVKNNHVAAILDWELCTLGDQLDDLGTVIA